MKAKAQKVPVYTSSSTWSRQAIIMIERTDKCTQQIKTGPEFFKLNKGETLESKAKITAQHVAGSKYKSYKLILS